VRTTARSSIRRRKVVSRPGQPPSSHTGLLKRFIFFGYDPARHSVVIGPVALARSDGKAPSLLEHGGMSRRAGRAVRYRRRPFMGPAMTKELPGLPKLWRDSVR